MTVYMKEESVAWVAAKARMQRQLDDRGVTLDDIAEAIRESEDPEIVEWREACARRGVAAKEKDPSS